MTVNTHRQLLPWIRENTWHCLSLKSFFESSLRMVIVLRPALSSTEGRFGFRSFSTEKVVADSRYMSRSEVGDTN